jgi:hypothetical protein
LRATTSKMAHLARPGALPAAPPAAAANGGASSVRDFEIVQPLGKGSYGSVHKAVRRADGLE